MIVVDSSSVFRTHRRYVETANDTIIVHVKASKFLKDAPICSHESAPPRRLDVSCTPAPPLLLLQKTLERPKIAKRPSTLGQTLPYPLSLTPRVVAPPPPPLLCPDSASRRRPVGAVARSGAIAARHTPTLRARRHDYDCVAYPADWPPSPPRRGRRRSGQEFVCYRQSMCCSAPWR
jgi:hypothetical protein